jgi:NADPH-dependent glutamate synthase beta subunit-like oxidoreductase
MARDGLISRRRFIRDAGAAAAASTAPGELVWHGTARAATRQQTAAVFGGGIAGLTAAHELAERGFAVTVDERRALGGKARSTSVPGSATTARRSGRR